MCLFSRFILINTMFRGDVFMKKRIACMLAMVMLFTVLLPVTALQLVGVESSAEPVITEALDGISTLSAVDLKPGINQINGLTTPETFAEWTTQTAKDKGITVGGSASPTLAVAAPEKAYEGHASDNALAMTSTQTADGGTYPSYHIPANLVQGRQYWIEFYLVNDMRLETNPAGTEQCLWILGGSNIGLSDAFKASVNQDKWYHYVLKGAWTLPTSSKLQLQGKQLKNEKVNLGTYWLDDLMIMPYYQVTYMNADGTAASTEQFLFDENGEVAVTYTPKTDNYPKTGGGAGATCVGWSTVNGAEEPMTAIPLQNEDIVLYPVWKIVPRELTASAEAISAAAGTTITLTANAPVAKWTFDLGATEATYTTTDTTAQIKAVGYAGVVTVSALFEGDTEPLTKTVRLYGGTKWKPGLNVITGTVEPYDFEDSATYTLATGATGSWKHTTIPDGATGNASNGAAKALAQFAILYGKQWSPKIEIDRPLDYQFDTLSHKNFYVMVNGSGGETKGGNIYSSSYGAGATKAWKHEKIKVTIATDKTQCNLKEDKAKDGISYIGVSGQTGTYTADDLTGAYLYIDNLSYIPYYKITYIGTDGNVDATEYVLYDENGKILTEYTPNLALVEGATAVSLEPDGKLIGGAIPLENKDLTLYVNTDKQYYIADADTYIKLTESECVIPDPADLGIETPYFLVWLDEDGNKLYPGEKFTADEMNRQVLTGYYQDVSQPAMGFSYEGNKTHSGMDKASGTKLEWQDGRDVIHMYYRNTTWNGTKYLDDVRIHFKTSKPLNANEYNVFQYMYSVSSAYDVKNVNVQLADDCSADSYSAKNQTTAKIYYYTSGSGYYNDCEHLVGNTVHTFPVDKDFHVLEVDMGDPGKSPSKHPWTKTGEIYGFALDPNRSTWSGDVYIDYVRVYRDGIFTVTYDTNAPSGAAVKKEVAPDTGRGVGTGYLLKGERPAVEGYEFYGWALSPNAGYSDVIDSVDLEGDLTVYAVWGQPQIQSSNLYSIRTKGTMGMRFSAFVTVAQREVATEYGFITALADSFADGDYTKLVFPDDMMGKTALAEGETKLGTLPDGTRYIYATSYTNDGSVDIHSPVSGEDLFRINAVLVNIAESDYQTNYVVRPYIRVGNRYFYGEPMVNNLYTIAKESSSDNEMIQSIITAVEGENA